MGEPTDCGLCATYTEEYRIVAKNSDAVSAVITNPLNEGHLIILPRRHALTLQDLTSDEARALNEVLYMSQQILASKFPDRPSVFGMQTGRHSTQPHIHYQMFPSDAHLRLMYAASNNSEGNAIPIDRDRTHPPYDPKRLEDIANELKK